jgi:hypothetical protein
VKQQARNPVVSKKKKERKKKSCKAKALQLIILYLINVRSGA